MRINSIGIIIIKIAVVFWYIVNKTSGLILLLY